jgi:hypothetical protein
MSHILSLPPELVLQIILLLPRKDLRSFSLVSSAARQLVLPSLFCQVSVSHGAESIKEAYDELNNAVEIKRVIR